MYGDVISSVAWIASGGPLKFAAEGRPLHFGLNASVTVGEPGVPSRAEKRYFHYLPTRRLWTSITDHRRIEKRRVELVRARSARRGLREPRFDGRPARMSRNIDGPNTDDGSVSRASMPTRGSTGEGIAVGGRDR